MNAMTVEQATSRADDAKLLRNGLRIDGLGTAGYGAILVVGGPWLSDLLGLPMTWAIPIGIALLGLAGAFALISGYSQIPSPLAWFVVVVNVLYAAVILPLTFSDVLPLTGLGIAFMLAGVGWVLLFAAVEIIGIRRARDQS